MKIKKISFKKRKNHIISLLKITEEKKERKSKIESPIKSEMENGRRRQIVFVKKITSEINYDWKFITRRFT